MSNKSLNQLYKEQVKYKLTKLSFKDWVEKGKALYEKYINAEMISPDVTFEMFANMIQPQVILNEDGSTSSTSFWDTTLGKILTTGATIGSDVIKQQSGGSTTTASTSTSSTSASVNPPTTIGTKTILGLQPIVFYSITTVVMLATAYGIYKLVSSKKA